MLRGPRRDDFSMDPVPDESSSASGGPPPLTPLAAAVLHVPRDPERVLQIACGSGDGVLFLAREFPRARVRGIDRSPEEIRAAVARVGLDPEGRVAFKHSRGRRIPYPDAHFDLIVQMGGLLSLSEVTRVLRPGGFLILAASRASVAPPGLGGRLARWRLTRRGFEQICAQQAGTGSFLVARLRSGGAVARSL